jgi:hypothetical protein
MKTENQNKCVLYEQQCQSHTRLGTIKQSKETTKPCYWLATKNTQQRRLNTEKDQKNKHRPSGLTRTSPLTRLKKIIQNTPNAEIPKKEIF